MKANLLWPLAVIVALVVGYLWQGGGAPTDAPKAERRAAQTAPQVAALTARIESLEAEVSALKVEREARAADDDEAPRARRIARRAARRAAEAEAEDAPAAGGADPAAIAEAIGDDPKVRTQLRRLIAREREAEREARHERFQERAAERTRQMVSDLADEVQLDEAQTSLVQEKLDAERKVVMDLFRNAREDGTFLEARQEADAIREATDAQVKAKLSEAQFKRYEELREENSWGPPGRRGRRDR